MSSPLQPDPNLNISPTHEGADVLSALRSLVEKQPPFALNSLLEEWGDEPEFLTRMLSVFVRDTRIDIDTIALEFEASDPGKLGRTAHHLKGAAAALGAEAIREQAAQLENMGRNGELKDAEACIEKLQAEFGSFLDCLSGIPLSTETA